MGRQLNRTTRTIVSLLVGFVGLMATVSQVQAATVTVYDSFSSNPFPGTATTSTDPEGVAFFGDNIWFSDDETSTLYRYNRGTTALATFPTDPYSGSTTNSKDIEGLAYDGTHLLVVGGTDFNTHAFLDKVDPATGSFVSRFDLTVTAGINDPEGAAWDGSAAWVADSNTVYKIDPLNGSLLNSFTFPGTAIEGLAWNGSYLLLGDVIPNHILLMETAGTIVETWTGLPDDPYGLAYDGTHVWMSDQHSRIIYRMGILGDVDLDGVRNADDIDWIYAQIGDPGSWDPADLDGDGDTDQNDVTKLVQDILNTQYGDVNLDMSVDLADFNDWLHSAPGAGWDGGDFNGDRTQDLADFNTWLMADIPTVPNALLTPEPTPLALLGLGGLLALHWRRRSGPQ